MNFSPPGSGRSAIFFRWPASQPMWSLDFRRIGRWFRETYDFIEGLELSYLHVFSYSRRVNTLAASMNEPVQDKIKKQRSELLHQLSENKRKSFTWKIQALQQMSCLNQTIPMDSCMGSRRTTSRWRRSTIPGLLTRLYLWHWMFWEKSCVLRYKALGTGYWMLDAGCWMLDAGCWMLDAGCWMLDAGCWMLDAGCWMLDAGCVGVWNE